MNRRKSMKAIIVGAVATFIPACKRVYGEVTKFHWPGFPSKDSLRNHLLYSSKHADLSDSYIRSLKTFQELINVHNNNHLKKGGKPFYGHSGQTVPGTTSRQSTTVKYQKSQTTSKTYSSSKPFKKNSGGKSTSKKKFFKKKNTFQSHNGSKSKVKSYRRVR